MAIIEMPYTLVPKRLQTFLERIPSDGQPDKLTVKTLEERGFRSSNDRSILRVMKAIGLTDDNGVPTQAWTQYRDRTVNRVILASLIRNTYRELFQVFPDACNRPEGDITNFMSAKTKSPASTVRLMVSTFQTLCSLADFDAEELELDDYEMDTMPTSMKVVSSQRGSRGQTSFPLPQLQVIMHLPETTDPDVYDTIFRSMARYLMGREFSAEDGDA